MKIPLKLYKKIVDVFPILCVDIVVEHKERFLLVKRKKEPAKGRWWVPGGRVFKGETIEKAVKRKIKEELGINVKILKALGYYEKHFKENEFGLKSGIHTVSIVVLVKPLSLNIKLNKQSDDWRFSKTIPKDFKIKKFNFS
jgi:colanic acid biosynthesis protein WcaH